MAACDMLDCELEYEEKPHLMGRPPLPDIRRRVARGPVHFAPTVETLYERLDDSGLWDPVISELAEKVNNSYKRYSGKKTQRRSFIKASISNDNPRKNVRKATFGMFLSCGMADLLKLHVDVMNELDNNYEVSADYDPDPPLEHRDPITDEGGTKEYAYWNFGLSEYETLLGDTLPTCGTYLIDLDNDLLYYFDAKTYEWLWRSHEGVDAYGGQRCVFLMSNPMSMIDELCSVVKWSEWSADLENLCNLRVSRYSFWLARRRCHRRRAVPYLRTACRKRQKNGVSR